MASIPATLERISTHFKTMSKYFAWCCSIIPTFFFENFLLDVGAKSISSGSFSGGVSSL